MIKPSLFTHVKKFEFSGTRKSGKIALPTLKAAKYGYSNARVGAMKGLLLNKEFLIGLTHLGNVYSVIEMLERTYYKDNLVKFSIHYHGSDLVQIATSMHFAEIVNKLERITPESDKEAFGVILMKWDLINAKTILNAKRIGKKYEEIAPHIIPIGSFTEAEIKGLLSEEGEFFSKFAKTNLGRKFVSNTAIFGAELEKLFRYMGTTEVMKLEALLDMFYYSLYSSIGKFSAKEFETIAKLFRREIDFKNALIIVRLKQHGINNPNEIAKYFIKGGLKQFGSFAELIDAKDMRDGLMHVGKKFGFENAPANVVELEMMLNRKFASAKLAVFYRSILSIGAIFSFLFIKEEEINNLRKIAIGKEFGMPDEKISEMLIFPNS
ncbi:MAG: V-type ATPase subunit [Candidatus Micrarchaeota archaeon]